MLAGGRQLEQGGTSGKRARTFFLGGVVIKRDHGLWAAGKCVCVCVGGRPKDGKRHVINHPNID